MTHTITGTALVKTRRGADGVSLQQVTVGPPGRGQALVRIAATGICGTDLHILDDEWPVRPPVTVGHELSGTVAAVGEGVDPDWVGQRVVSEVFYGSDGTCDSCRAGHRNLCPNRESLGSHVDGAFAPAVLVPARILHAVPDSIDLVDAALIEPLACVAGALFDPPLIVPSDRVLVTGPGAIGQLAAQVARASGASVVLAGLPADAQRLAIASNLGFNTMELSPETAAELHESFDVVIECAGAADAMTTCLDAVMRRGRYVQLGLAGAPVPFAIDAVCLKEITITSGFGATPSGFRQAIRLVSDGHVTLAPLVTRAAPIEEWTDVIAATRSGQGVKFLLTPSPTNGATSPMKK